MRINSQRTKPVRRLLTAPALSRGLSLVELMVSLAISSVLMLGVSSIYLDSRRTDHMGEALARIQETGRLAISLMAQDLRMVGYQGCLKSETLNVNVIARNAPTTDLFSSALRGYEVADSTWANGTEFDNTTIETRALVGSDVIASQRAMVAGIQLTGNMGAVNANIQVNGNPLGFVQNQLVIIADCNSADIFRITNNPGTGTGTITLTHANGANSNTDNRLSAAYNTDAQIMSFSSVVYFVAATGRTNAEGMAINALYRQTDNLTAPASSFTIEELVEGVDSMQVLYGERLASGNIRYVPADEVTSMALVESIRLGLLISSVNPVQQADDNQSYELPGETIVPAGGAGVTHPVDRRIRRDFSVTINLRNRQS